MRNAEVYLASLRVSEGVPDILDIFLNNYCLCWAFLLNSLSRVTKAKMKQINHEQLKKPTLLPLVAVSFKSLIF